MTKTNQIKRKSKRKSSLASTTGTINRLKDSKQVVQSPIITKKKGKLAKVANFVGHTAGIASKFLPGVAGTVAKGLANLLNDPEWWQSEPGTEVTLNAPLAPIKTSSGFKMRSMIAEFVTTQFNPGSGNDDKYNGLVINLTTNQVTQYILPQIRKVVNAIPLQASDTYKEVIEYNSTVYALWQQLKKFKYLTEHGKPYLASLDDPALPLLNNVNAAWLQSTINRLEAYLRANVRLPHTLCEYLAWRFGRIYQSNNSQKAGLVMYNVLPLASGYGGNSTDPYGNVAQYDALINKLMALPSSSVAYQQANADIYNTYIDHDYQIEVADHTQFSYDPKEFALRTNLDILTSGTGSDAEEPNLIYLDSALDNKTAFMASSVSTACNPAPGSGIPKTYLRCLFPVNLLTFIYPKGDLTKQGAFTTAYVGKSDGDYALVGTVPATSSAGLLKNSIYLIASGVPTIPTAGTMVAAVAKALLMKAMDIYNKDVNVIGYLYGNSAAVASVMYDLTSLNQDLGLVQDSVLQIEQLYAVANLFSNDRKRSMTFKQAENQVVAETEELIKDVVD